MPNVLIGNLLCGVCYHTTQQYCGRIHSLPRLLTLDSLLCYSLKQKYIINVAGIKICGEQIDQS